MKVMDGSPIRWMGYPLALLLVFLAVYPVSANSDSHLFVIERSTNANVIHYDGKILQDGKLDPKTPVVAYWIMAAEDGRRESLSFVERQKAYGFTIRPGDSPGVYRMTLVSQRSHEIRIYLQGGTARAETSIDGSRAYLVRIFVKTRKSGPLRTADYYELFGIDIMTGEARYEKVAPQN